MFFNKIHQSSRSNVFSGQIKEIPGLFVDNFENLNTNKPRAFFLSHCHTDHTKGLQSSTLVDYLVDNDVYIYTTELSAAIIKTETNNIIIMDNIKILELGSTLITLPEAGDLPEVFLTVTLVPAGHCAGSVMFLFQTVDCTLLYTGDFRIHTPDISKYAALHDTEGMPINIDCLYVDTTFIDCAYENFPKRTDSVDKMLVEISMWIGRGGIALHTSAKYGYEFVFNEIYRRFGKKVYVDSERWKFYRSIPHLVPGVTNDIRDTQVHLCSKRNENKHTDCVPNTDYKQYLYVHMSAMKWTNYSGSMKSVVRVSPTRLDVCFATHCSRSELMAFVKYLSPKRIVGFPNPFLDARGVKRKCDVR